MTDVGEEENDSVSFTEEVEGEFQQKLINIDEEMGDDDMYGLKFLCSDYIPVSKLQSSTSPLDIFNHMRKAKLIDVNNVDFLIECLGCIYRFDLIKMMGLDPHTISNLNKVTPYRRILMKVAEKMDDTDKENLRFYLSGAIKKNKLSKARSILDMFIVLEQEQIISPEKPEGVGDLMTAIGRPDLVSIVKDFLGGVDSKQHHLLLGSRSCAPRQAAGIDHTPRQAAGIDHTPSTGTLTVSENGASSSTANKPPPPNLPMDQMGGDARELPVPVGPPVNEYDPQEQSENICMSNREAQPWREPPPIDPQVQYQNIQQIENQMQNLMINSSQLNPQQVLNQTTQGIQQLVNASNLEQITVGPTANLQVVAPAEASPAVQDSVVDQDADSSLQEYDMTRKPRGWCVIINNEEFTAQPGQEDIRPRRGTNVDAEILQKVFSDLNFVVHRRNNLSDTEMMQHLVDVAHNVDHRQFDCLVVCILTHGVLNHVQGSNGKLVSIKDITSTFQANRCPNLAGKPKLFFLQACQGENKMPGKELERDCTTVEIDGGQEMIPNEADFLIGYATVPGYVSYRSVSKGSWYIRKLCELLEKYSAGHDLLSILVEVNREVSRGNDPSEGQIFKQIPAPLVTLRKKLYFR